MLNAFLNVREAFEARMAFRCIGTPHEHGQHLSHRVLPAGWRRPFFLGICDFSKGIVGIPRLTIKSRGSGEQVCYLASAFCDTMPVRVQSRVYFWDAV
jgi:hypothetical protein